MGTLMLLYISCTYSVLCSPLQSNEMIYTYTMSTYSVEHIYWIRSAPKNKPQVNKVVESLYSLARTCFVRDGDFLLLSNSNWISSFRSIFGKKFMHVLLALHHNFKGRCPSRRTCRTTTKHNSLACSGHGSGFETKYRSMPINPFPPPK